MLLEIFLNLVLTLGIIGAIFGIVALIVTGVSLFLMWRG